MKNKRNVFVISLISLLTIALACAIIFSNPKKALSDDTTKEAFVTHLMESVSSAKNRRALIDAYCSYTATSEGFYDSSAPGLYYDPQQSLFLGLLCKHSDDRNKIEDLVTSFDWESLALDGCSWESDMTSCDLSVFLPKLFAIVMNDLSKAKLAQLYSYQGTSTDEAIKAFSDTYFGPGDSICGSKNVIYLGDTQGSPKEAPCMHPQTRVILSQYFQQAQQLVSKTTYIDAKQLLTSRSKNCANTSKDFLVCAFDNSNNNTAAWDQFHNLIYNELLFYKLFITLAMDRLQYPEFNKFRVYSDTSTEARQEMIRMSQETALGESAVAYMEKTLQNMQTAFPIHIGLLAYYEDIISIRSSLLRIYTPIHQLYYKLRNVQQKQ